MDAYDVNGISCPCGWIKLRRDVKMTSQYEGRGIPAKTKTFEAGTVVRYNAFPYNASGFAARAGETITRWVHTVQVREGRTTFLASHETTKKECGE